MRTSLKLGSIGVSVAVAAALLAGTPAASAAGGYRYAGYSGGTQVSALDGSVVSDRTAQSAISGFTTPNTFTNSVASAKAAKLLTTGAVTTDETASDSGDGVQIVSHAKTAGVALLGSLIRADAVETTNIATKTSSGMHGATTTKFVNLKVSGIKIPINVPQNFTISLPGIATVVLNGSYVSYQDDSVYSNGFAIYVKLLQPRGDAPLGSTLIVNPTYSVTLPPAAPSTNALLGGGAYGTRVQADAGTQLAVGAGPSALLALPNGGTGGDTKTNSTAGVNLPGVLKTGAVQTTVTGTTNSTLADGVATSETAGINVLGGLIKADAIKVTAHVHKDAPSSYTSDTNLTFVNLVIAGQAIPVNVSPNTKISIPGVGSVTVNEQSLAPNQALIKAVDVTLDTAQAGLPVGATIEVGVAVVYING